MASKKPQVRKPRFELVEDIDPASLAVDRLYDEAKPTAAKNSEEPSMWRSIGDSGLALGSGLVTGVKLISDAFGADNPVSRTLGEANQGMQGLLSDARKAELQNRARLIREAENSGSTWEEVKAYGGSFAEAPLDTLLNVAGTAAPTMASMLIPGAREANIARALGMTTGAVQGAGAGKSSIYDAVLQRAFEEGKTDEEARALADEAQSYLGKNTDTIAANTLLGVIAGGSGVESAVRALRYGKTAGAAAPGMVRRVATGALVEGVPEGAQGGLEKLSGNVALQREGYEDVPTMRGVVGSAALEGMAGSALGGALSIPAPKEVGPLTKAANAGIAAAPPAPAPVPLTPEQEQSLLDHANQRARELEEKANGTKDQKITGPDGKPMTIPGKKAEFLTPQEKAERDFLAENGGDAQALAGVYAPKPTEAPTQPVNQDTGEILAEQAAPAAEPAEAPAPAEPASPAFDSIEKADDYVTAQVKRGSAVKGVPVQNEDGTITLVPKTDPRYPQAVKDRLARRKARKEQADAGSGAATGVGPVDTNAVDAGASVDAGPGTQPDAAAPLGGDEVADAGRGNGSESLTNGVADAGASRQDGTDAVIQGGLTLLHGSPSAGITLESIQIVRDGQKQGKKGRKYGGLYLTAADDVKQAEGYASMGQGTPTIYEVDIKDGAKVLRKDGDITRLSESYINELRAQGYDLVIGKDPRGYTEFVAINKDAITRFAPRGNRQPAQPSMLTATGQQPSGLGPQPINARPAGTRGTTAADILPKQPQAQAPAPGQKDSAPKTEPESSVPAVPAAAPGNAGNVGNDEAGAEWTRSTPASRLAILGLAGWPSAAEGKPGKGAQLTANRSWADLNETQRSKIAKAIANRNGGTTAKTTAELGGTTANASETATANVQAEQGTGTPTQAPAGQAGAPAGGDANAGTASNPVDAGARYSEVEADGLTYPQRNAARMARVEATTDQAEADAALQEEYTDDERDFERTSKLEQAVRRVKLRASQEQEAKKALEAYERGEWVQDDKLTDLYKRLGRGGWQANAENQKAFDDGLEAARRDNPDREYTAERVQGMSFDMDYDAVRYRKKPAAKQKPLAQILADQEAEIAASNARHKATMDRLGKELGELSSRFDKTRNKGQKRDELNDLARESRVANEYEVKGILDRYRPIIEAHPEEIARRAESKRKTQEMKAQMAQAASPAKREAFEHAGLKVYPTRVNIGGEPVDRWAVQLPENRGTNKTGGDPLHETIEQAKKSAEYEAKRASDKAERDAAEKAEADEREAKKEANRGKSVLERRADAVLDKPVSYEGKPTTRRALIESAVEQGLAFVEAKVFDSAAKKRDEAAVEAARRAGYILGLSNENLPAVKAALEAQARLKANKYDTKAEYRLYQSRKAEGPFREITKIEYDYALKLEAQARGEQAPEQTKPAKETKPQREAREAEERRAAYFTPGNIVQGYGGHDRVIAYNPPNKPGGAWSVRVQHVVKRDGEWIVDPNPVNGRERSHATEPSAVDYKRGPVAQWKEVAQDNMLPDGWAQSENGFTKRPVFRKNQDIGQPFAVVTNTEGMTYEIDVRHGDNSVGGARVIGARSEALAKADAMLAKATETATTHKDPGQSPEAVTPGVVKDSLSKAAKNEGRKPSQMKADLLAQIDAAIAKAPEDGFRAPVWREPTEEQLKQVMKDNDFTDRQRARQMMLDYHYSLVEEAADKRGRITFDVPGDGQFKVLNDRERLADFRKKVQASPGFKDNGTPAPVSDRTKNDEAFGVERGSSGTEAAIRNMLDEGDFQAAKDYADFKGLTQDEWLAIGKKLPKKDQPAFDAWNAGQREPANPIGENPPGVEQPQGSDPKPWHTPLPTEGGKVTNADRTSPSNPKSVIDGRKVVMRLAKDAMDAITKNQRENIATGGIKLTPWVLPATNDRNGVVRLLPEDQTPGAPWQQLGTEPIRMGGTADQALYQLTERLRSAPIIASDDAAVIDLKGFERVAREGGAFELRDGNMVVRVEPMGDGKFQASFRGAKSSPHLQGEQGAVDWAATYREDAGKPAQAPSEPPVTASPPVLADGFSAMRGHVEDGRRVLLSGDRILTVKAAMNGWELRNEGGALVSGPHKSAQALESAVVALDGESPIPEGYKPAGEPFYRNGKLTQGYAPFALGDRVTMKESAGQSGVIEGFARADENAVFEAAMVRFDNGSGQLVSLRQLTAEATPGSAPEYPLAPAGSRYEESDKPIKMMSPDEFLAAVRPLEIDEASRDNIDDLKRHILAGKTLDPLHIRADGKEDGRHRAVAAKELGIKQVPVIDERTGAKPTGANKIEDFGEKLLGARKDYATLLKDADSVDIKTEPLSKSWPEPDYQKLLDGGADPFMVSFIRAARDELPTKPQNSWKLQGWVAQAEMLRGLAQKLLSGTVTTERLQELMSGHQFSEVRKRVGGRADLYQAVGHSKSLKGITLQEHFYTLYHGKSNVNLWVVEQPAKATAFSNWPKELATGATKEQAIAAFKAKFDSLELGGSKKKAPTFSIYHRRGQPGAIIGKKVGREYIDLHRVADVNEARAYRDANEKALTEALERYKTTPYERSEANLPRVGDDHRSGAPVTPEVFADTFGFRGVQFGNYVEQGRRQSDLNEAFDALMDLAAVLDLPPRALSLNGRLGLAFGARGKGGKNAPAAHFESGNVVINLTKGGGPGSLAHEWWHALDNYFAREAGGSGFVTGGTAMDKLRVEMQRAFASVKRATLNTGLLARSRELDKRRSKPYWSTPVELSARSFEAFIIAKLQDQNAANEYLANIVSEESWNAMESGRLMPNPEPSYPYPTQKELESIRAAFDEFFRTVETRKDEAGNVAMFSRRGSGRGIPMRDAQASVDIIRAQMPSAPEIVLLDNVADAPAGLRKTINERKAANNVEAVYWEGKIYAFPKHFDSLDRFMFVVGRHEVRHAGLDAMLGDNKDATLVSIGRANRRVMLEARQMMADGIADSFAEGVEEALADMPVEDIAALSRIKILVAAIRRWLRSTAFKLRKAGMRALADAIEPKQWTDNDVIAFVFKAEEVSRGPGPGKGGRFSRTDAPAWYSALTREVGKVGMKAAPAQGWQDTLKGMVQKGQVKRDEIEWTGLGDWLALQEGKVSKEQVLEFLDGNGVQVQEVVLGGISDARRRAEELGYFVGQENDGSFELYDENNDPIHQDDITPELAEIRKQLRGADDTKYGHGNLVLPGGENYREVLLTLPRKADQQVKRLTTDEFNRYRDLEGLVQRGEASDAETAEFNQFVERNTASQRAYSDALKADGRTEFVSTHWNQRNILAHIRVNDRTDADGKRVLFVEEIQSDWGQEGKKSGFKGAFPDEVLRAAVKGGMSEAQARADIKALMDDPIGTDQRPTGPMWTRLLKATEGSGLDLNEVFHDRQESGVPNAPFVTKTEGWLNLALKRVMTMAVEGGYDRVAFVTGEQSAERYDLSKQVDQLTYDSGVLRAFQGRTNVLTQKAAPEQVEDYVGKEVAKRLLESPEEDGRRVLMGESLKVGGEGMKAFYDTIVPNAAKALLKKVGGGQMAAVQMLRPVASDIDPNWGTPRFDPDKWGMNDDGEVVAPQPGFNITPAMRDKLGGGLPLFSRAPGFFFDAKESPLYKERDGKGVVTGEQAQKALATDAVARRIMAKGIEVQDGDLVGVRLNINVLRNTGVPVNTIHRGTKGDGYTRNKGLWNGEVMAYEPVVTVREAYLNVGQKAREAIATGADSKSPMASVDGRYVKTDTHSFDGVEFRFNPAREHLFRDGLGRVLKYADEVTVAGHSVFARGRIEYFGAEDVPARAGDAPTEGRLLTPGDNTGTARFSRAPGRTKIVTGADGHPEYEYNGIQLVFPLEDLRFEVLPVGEPRKVLRYAVMPSDDFQAIGYVELLVDSTGKPESLLDIQADTRHDGMGRKVIEAILRAYPTLDLNISNIVPAAQGFWEKMGIPTQNREEGAAYDGTLNLETYLQAQDGRGAQGGDGRGQEANSRFDAGPEAGPYGAVQGRQVSGARFSRRPLGSLRDAAARKADAVKATELVAGYRVGDFLESTGKLSWWDKTVGTPYNLAKRFPGTFGKVYDAVQSFLSDVSYYATEAANLAPNLLPKLEHLRDIAKQAISPADNKAISAPIFEGTLTWTRDETGKAVKSEDVLDRKMRRHLSMTTAQMEAELIAENQLDAKTQAEWRKGGDKQGEYAKAVANRFREIQTERLATELVKADLLPPGILAAWRSHGIERFEAMIARKYEAELARPGVVWSDAELRQKFGLNDKQVDLYKEFRAATDKSLDDLTVSEIQRLVRNELGELDLEGAADDIAMAARDRLFALAEANPADADALNQTADMVVQMANRLKDLKARGYAPLSRFGHYTLDVVDDQGDRVFFGLYESQAEANRAARKMREQFPGATVTQGTQSTEDYKRFAGISPETIELFGDMLGLDATGDAASDRAFQEYLKKAKASRSAMKRLIHRKGIAGFSEDVGRVLAGFVSSNARRTASNHNMKAITESVDAIPREEGQLRDYANQMTEYVSNPIEEAQAFRGLMFAQYLGGSVASALVNMMQPIAVTMPYLSQFGGPTKASAAIVKAFNDMALRTKLEDGLAEALVRAEEDGIVAPQEIHQLQAQARGQGSLRSGDGTKAGDAAAKASNMMSRVSLAWGKLFGFAEMVNRRVTFIAAYRMAVANGNPNPAKFAADAVVETQFTYNKGNRPKWARGAIGATLFTFKTYSISYVELLTRLYKQGGPEGKKAFMFAIATMLLMSGLDELPFMEDAEDVIDGVAQGVFGLNWQTKLKRQEMLADLLGKDVADFLSKGVSGIPGVPIDVSGRLGLGNLIPGTGLFRDEQTNTGRDWAEIIGPAGDLVQRGVKAVGLAAQGEFVKAGLEASPVAVRNVAKAADMAEMGMYRDARGKMVTQTNGFEAFVKGIGFQPNSVAKVQDGIFTKQRMIALNKKVEAEIADLWALGRFENNPEKVERARNRLKEWNRDNPESPIRIEMNQVTKRVKAMRMSKQERIDKTAPKELRAEVRKELSQ